MKESDIPGQLWKEGSGKEEEGKRKWVCERECEEKERDKERRVSWQQFLVTKSIAPAVHHQLDNKSQHTHHDYKICRKRLKVILRVHLDMRCSDGLFSQ